MSQLTKTINSLQNKLEELSSFTQKKRSTNETERTKLDEAYKHITQLQGELHKAKIELSDKTLKTTQLHQELGDKEKDTNDKAKKLEEREKSIG